MPDGLFANPLHWAILIVIVLIIFGPGKLPGVGSAMLGQSFPREFKKASQTDNTPPAHNHSAERCQRACRVRDIRRNASAQNAARRMCRTRSFAGIVAPRWWWSEAEVQLDAARYGSQRASALRCLPDRESFDKSILRPLRSAARRGAGQSLVEGR